MPEVKKNFSEREMQLMACAFQAMRNPTDIDYSVMASLAGMSNPRSASNAMGAIRKKLNANMPAGTAVPGSGPRPKTPGGRKKKRNVDDDDDDDDEDGGNIESPTKKAKANGKANGKGGAKGKRGAIKKEDTPEDDDSDNLSDEEAVAREAYADAAGYNDSEV
ncbi:uncharacterized protein J3D65DRAFT_669240 [Phyllosticta citribraziliensis]|uniref:Uncharacterized protein n=1 Tax=Phyllosticta citribraziliensis TaxID=989973 RepID=A0ABR1LIU7_9PEZI